jgi:hypothetical protein
MVGLITWGVGSAPLTLYDNPGRGGLHNNHHYLLALAGIEWGGIPTFFSGLLAAPFLRTAQEFIYHICTYETCATAGWWYSG